MNEYKIERGIPAPRPAPKGGVLGKLQVGDSFIVPKEKASSIRTTASRYKRIYGWEFTVKNVSGELRLWRIK